MTRQQQKLCELMLEFHRLCDNEGVAYYLIGPQLLHAAQGGAMHGYEMDVAMFRKDWARIAKWAKQSKRIVLEGVRNGGNLPGCFYRFVDKNTLLLDLDRYGVLAKPGTGIHIHIIRSRRKKENFLRLLEKGMNDASAHRLSLASSLVVPLRAVMGRKRFGEWAVSLLKTVGASKKDLRSATELYEPGDHLGVFEPGFWAERTTVRLENMHLYTMSGYTDYLKQRYGAKWRTCPTDAVKETYRCVFSNTLPYAKYMARLKSEGLVTRQFRRRLRRYAAGERTYQPMKNREQDGWDRSIFFSEERFRLWKKYMPLKEQILSLYDRGELDAVELMLSDYMSVLNRYLAKNMVMCFDRDLLNIVKGLYLTYGNAAKARKIDKYVLPADLKPIVPTWRTADAEECQDA